MVTIDDIKARIKTPLDDSVIQKLIDYSNVITRKYLGAKPNSPMVEKIKASKLAWLSFNASDITKIVKLEDNSEVTNYNFQGAIVFGLQENKKYEVAYEIEDYDSLMIVMDEVITQLTIESILSANEKLKGKLYQSENIGGDYSYTLAPDFFDSTKVKKILSPLKQWKVVHPVVAL